MKKFIKSIGIALATILFLTACNSDTSNNNSNQAESGLPKQMVWSVYSVGSGTYNDMATIADVFTSEYKSQIRLLPSDTGIGRLQRLKDGTAQIGVLGEEYVYGFEGNLDFASKDWGPQDLRYVWGPPSPLGLAVRKDSGIETVEDLKGKVVPLVISNPSVNNKMEAYLAYAGLTYDDVKTEQFSYSDQADAFKSGKIDAIIMNPYGSAMFELESAVDFKWLNLDPARIDQVNKVASTVVIAPFTDGAGMKDGEEVYAISYPTPLIAYSSEDVNEIYELVKAINDQYDKYKDTTITLKDFNIEKSLIAPTAVPFHEGTIKYLKEQNLWTDEAEKKNNLLLERQKQLQENWKVFIEQASEDNIQEEWLKWKAENIK